MLFITACSGGNNGSNNFNQLVLTAVDSTNDRIFIMEQDRVFSILTASTLNDFVDQPLVDEDHLIPIYNILPTEPTFMEVQAIDTSSRIFIYGATSDDVTNQITVLDFDGTNLTIADFSPISVGDSETNIFNGMEINPDTDELYITIASIPSLFVISTTTGEEVEELALNGSPQNLHLDADQLYIANASTQDDQKGIMVIDTTNDPLVVDDLLTINPNDDRDIAPIFKVNVLSFGNTMAVLAQDADRQIVYVKELANNTLSDIAITLDSDEEDSDIDGNNQGLDGELNTGNGISSSVGDIVLAISDDDNLFGYVPQSDGRFQELTFSSDLSSFSSRNLSTGNLNMQSGSVFNDPDGLRSTVYFASPGADNLVYIRTGNDSVRAKD